MSFKVTRNYHTVHAWIRRKYGRADKCESPTCSGKSKRFTYAKKKGKRYSKNRDNYIMLCYSCHIKYDRTRLSLVRMKRNSVNKKKTVCSNGHKYEGENVYRYGKEMQYRGCRTCIRNNNRRFYKSNPLKFKLYRIINREKLNASWRRSYYKRKLNKEKVCQI